MSVKCDFCQSSQLITKQRMDSPEVMYEGQPYRVQYLQTYRECLSCKLKYTDEVAELEENRATQRFFLEREEIKKAIEEFKKEDKIKEILKNVDFVIICSQVEKEYLYAAYWANYLREYQRLFQKEIEIEKFYTTLFLELVNIATPLYPDNKTIELEVVRILTRTILFYRNPDGRQEQKAILEFIKVNCHNLYPVYKLQKRVHPTKYQTDAENLMGQIQDIILAEDKDSFMSLIKKADSNVDGKYFRIQIDDKKPLGPTNYVSIQRCLLPGWAQEFDRKVFAATPACPNIRYDSDHKKWVKIEYKQEFAIETMKIKWHNSYHEIKNHTFVGKDFMPVLGCFTNCVGGSISREKCLELLTE